MDKMEENYIDSPERSVCYKPGINPDEKIIVFATGKHKDEEFMKVCKQDPSYIKWFMENVASEFTKNMLRTYYNKHRSKS
jgi:hypothetical protein